ncbi:hypothetical protein EYF80_056332 [Liparis tanakae]|uniref:Uncharacterized protein n=1 Tax=Liparis tanakae TaxID=230148 RepID=A0A4Z2EXM3_9TELE|nr:hypothetical protein EYF80_056332 [Liparis tanakae]
MGNREDEPENGRATGTGERKQVGGAGGMPAQLSRWDPSTSIIVQRGSWLSVIRCGGMQD